MRRVVPTLLAVLPFALAACAGGQTSGGESVQLTRVGEAVQVTENEATARDCEYVAELPNPRSPTDNALRQLRNEAGNAGANLVLLIMESRTTIARVEGYLCAD